MMTPSRPKGVDGAGSVAPQEPKPGAAVGPDPGLLVPASWQNGHDAMPPNWPEKLASH